MNPSSSSLALFACLLSSTAFAAPAVVHVANNGVDSSACGSSAAPCRSIGQGIVNAKAGDTVLVRPGRYGDLNKDGQLAGAGEEQSSGRSAIFIGKPLRVVSTDGAEATVIDGGNGPGIFATVLIQSGNVVFGEAGAGFHLVGAESGLEADQVTNTRIAGNIVSGVRAHGFLVYSTGSVDVSYNVAHDNAGVGFIVGGAAESLRVVLHHNQSYSNGQGVLSANLGRNEIAWNDISNNAGVGISVDFAPSSIHHNTIAANDIGIASNSWSPDNLPSAGPVLYRNSLIGNQRFGIMVQPGPGLPVRTVVRENNFIGNALAIPPEFFGPNCGLANFSGQTLNATNSYWGAATGPGADPADVACGNDPVTTQPFARSPN